MSQEVPWKPEAEQELARRLGRLGWAGERALALRRRVEAVTRGRGRRTVAVADLDEAQAQSMGGGPRETPPATRGLAWDPDARRNLEQETIYLRERLRQRVEALARESGQTRVTLDLVTQVRQAPSPGMARRAAETVPAV
ncbi:MAG: hypothetical protein CL878_05815, partial [Dehalococcoidia bacterium]|nr:hypothetical protein [Dehalococcoidia bacterium]